MNRDEARLRELGLWPAHGLLVSRTAVPAPPPEAKLATGPGVGAYDWPALDAAIRSCTACGLCRTRIQAVPGAGSQQARLLVVGEAPGADEDQRGEPFVGRAGQLLEQMLLAIGVRREQAFIANVLKCRPPENRDPAPDEMAACRPFLDRQIALLQPRVILALGSCAVKALLGGEGRVGSLRGQEHEHAGTPVVVSYHPAYLLRNTADKSKAWEDLCRLRALLTQDAKSAGAGSTG